MEGKTRKTNPATVLLFGLLTTLLFGAGCKTMRTRAWMQDNSLPEASASDESTKTIPILLSGIGNRPRIEQFADDTNLGEVADAIRTNSLRENSIDDYFVCLQRQNQVLVFPYRVALLSAAGQIRLAANDRIFVENMEGLKSRDWCSNGPYDYATFEAKRDLTKSGVNLAASSEELLRQIEADSEAENSFLEPLRKAGGDLKTKSRLITVYLGETSEQARLARRTEALDAIKRIQTLLNGITADDAITDRYRDVFVNGDRIGALDVVKYKTVDDIVNSLKPSTKNLSYASLVSKKKQKDTNGYVVQVLIPLNHGLEEFREAEKQQLSRFLMLSTDVDSINLYTSLAQIPIVRQGLLQPQIEAIVERRQKQLDDGRRWFERFRSERRRRFPISSRLPSSVGNYFRPLEAGVGNATRTTQSFLNQLVR